MNPLNPIEEECEDVLTALIDKIAVGHSIGRMDYVILMDRVRQAHRHLVNKRLGCWSGRHTDFCTCEPGKEGVNINAMKYPRKVRS